MGRGVPSDVGGKSGLHSALNVHNSGKINTERIQDFSLHCLTESSIMLSVLFLP